MITQGSLTEGMPTLFFFTNKMLATLEIDAGARDIARPCGISYS